MTIVITMCKLLFAMVIGYDNMAFYGLRAKGGAASVTISEGIVHSATGKS